MILVWGRIWRTVRYGRGKLHGIPARYRAVFITAEMEPKYAQREFATSLGMLHARDLALELAPDGEWYLWHLEMLSPDQ